MNYIMNMLLAKGSVLEKVDPDIIPEQHQFIKKNISVQKKILKKMKTLVTLHVTAGWL